MSETVCTIGLIANPISGRGEAVEEAVALGERLRRSSFVVTVRKSARAYDPGEIRRFLEPLDVLVVLGGDGTVSPLLLALAETNTPLFVWPAGNESLFSREFGMVRDMNRLIETLESPTFREVYFGACEGQHFFHMVSVGFDSQIIEGVAKGRIGPVGKRGYFAPIARTIFRYRAPEFTLRVDGKEELQNACGHLVVANTKQYAGRLTPVPEANPYCGRLFGRFFPYRTIRRHLPWLINYMRKTPVDLSGTMGFSGKTIEVLLTNSIYPVQADGELLCYGSFSASMSKEKIRVLLPKERSNGRGEDVVDCSNSPS